MVVNAIFRTQKIRENKLQIQHVSLKLEENKCDFLSPAWRAWKVNRIQDKGQKWCKPIKRWLKIS